MGIDIARSSHIALGNDPVALAIGKGEIFVAEGEPVSVSGHPYPITACVPLRLTGKTNGALFLHRLLPQKPGIEDIDRELFALLAVHAAMALYATKLHQAAVAR